MKQKKAQVAFFVVVAILLAIVIGFLIYLGNLEKEEILLTVESTKKVPFEIAPIKEFVEICLKNTALDSLELIGKQGGYLYKSQGGTYIDFKETDKGKFFTDYAGLKLPFIISKPKFRFGPYFVDAPDYPWESFPYLDGTSSGQAYNGYFGVNNLPPLIKDQGPHSIQSQIESYVKSNIRNCADFSVFEAQGFKINSGEVNANAIIASNDLTIILKHPLQIISQDGKTTRIEDFSTNFDIRLRDFYNFVNELISNEVNNIKFDIDDPSNERDNFKIRTMRGSGDFEVGHNDVIIIEDEQSRIKGKPFKFNIARQNRLPALFFIDDSSLRTYNTGESIFDLRNNLIDSAQPISKYVLDPDEDIFTINSFSFDPGLDYIFRDQYINPKFRVKVSVKDHGGLEDFQILNFEVRRR